jgi:hypothetical protein
MCLAFLHPVETPDITPTDNTVAELLLFDFAIEIRFSHLSASLGAKISRYAPQTW